MKALDLISENISRPNSPKWELDLPNKVYVVYDQTGNEVSRHTFEQVWNSSPARDAAQKDVNELKIKLKKQQDIDSKNRAEAKPLSTLEQEYIDLENKRQKYFAALYPLDKSPSILDDETKEIYVAQLEKWNNRLDRLSSSGTIRNSVVMGTYKPAN